MDEEVYIGLATDGNQVECDIINSNTVKCSHINVKGEILNTL